MTLDVLIPTYRRPAALAVTLTSVTAQTFDDFRVVISDQTEDGDAASFPEPAAAIRVLRFRGRARRERYRLHNAANLCHVQARLQLTPQTQRLYHVAWVGGCVLYDSAKLRAAGGFGFWPELPPNHAGEDVLAQQRVMARFGGCGLIPSGAYHQELPTTLPNREVDAPRVLDFAG